MRWQDRSRRHLKYVKKLFDRFWGAKMDCRASLIYAHLAFPGLDPDEVRLGEMVTLLVAVSALLVTRFLLWATMLL